MGLLRCFLKSVKTLAMTIVVGCVKPRGLPHGATQRLCCVFAMLNGNTTRLFFNKNAFLDVIPAEAGIQVIGGLSPPYPLNNSDVPEDEGIRLYKIPAIWVVTALTIMYLILI